MGPPVVLSGSKDLAMVIDAQNSDFKYDDAKWTSDDEFDNGASKKTAAYFKKANSITLVDTETGNEVTWEHGLDMSLKELMSGGFQNHCNRQGFMVVDDPSWRPMRFGLIMNQENNCGSPDSAIGIGHKTGSLAAGASCSCCQNGGSCNDKPANVEVYVMG